MTWRDRMKRAVQPISKMEVEIMDALCKRGIRYRTDEELCIVSTRPDFTIFTKQLTPIHVYLDGYPHLKTRQTEKDKEAREILRKRGAIVLEISYLKYTKKEAKRVIREILQHIYPHQEVIL